MASRLDFIDSAKALPIKDGELLESVKTLRAQGAYDLILDPQGLLKSALVASFLKGPVFGYDFGCTKECLAPLFYGRKLRFDYGENVIARALALAHFAFGKDFSSFDLSAFMASREALFRREIKSRGDFLLLNSGTSKANKSMSNAQLQRLCQALNSLNRKIIITWGNEAEKERAKGAAMGLSGVELAPKLSQEELIDLTSQAALLIGFDTGPSHIALAQRVKSLLLFSATKGLRSTVVTDENKFIQRDDFAKLNMDEVLNISKELLCIS